MNDDTNKPADAPRSAAPDTAVPTPPAPLVPAAKPVAARTPVKPRAPRVARLADGATAARPVAAGRNKTIATPAAVSKPATRKATVRKPAPRPAATKPAPEIKAAKPVKPRKVKLVRDSFTMPETEYAVIAELKARCLAAGVSAKKSEILRAALAGLAKLGDASLMAAIRKLDVIKTGRPAKQVK